MPMRLCSGCRAKIPETVRFCDQCSAERNHGHSDDGIRTHSDPNVYNAELDKCRTGARWQRIRRRVVIEEPLCRECQLSITEIVDHIVPAPIAVQQARESGRWPFDRYAGYYLRSNLQGLCRQCHARKTERDKQHVGPWPNVVEAHDKAPKKKWVFA
jgi:5-methylcytosine-specific restriction endonuclease McrA